MFTVRVSPVNCSGRPNHVALHGPRIANETNTATQTVKTKATITVSTRCRADVWGAVFSPARRDRNATKTPAQVNNRTVMPGNKLSLDSGSHLCQNHTTCDT